MVTVVVAIAAAVMTVGMVGESRPTSINLVLAAVSRAIVDSANQLLVLRPVVLHLRSVSVVSDLHSKAQTEAFAMNVVRGQSVVEDVRVTRAWRPSALKSVTTIR
jgi:hypothetical protein